MIYLVIVLLTLFIDTIASDCKCGIENKSTRIIGGTVVQQNKYPWIVVLRLYKENGVSRCGGSIINERYILTAAHCLDGISKVSVAVGVNDIPFSDKFLNTEKFIIHPNYNRIIKRNDIGLVMLSQPLTFTRNVQPICMPTENIDVSGKFVVAGWGSTENGSLSDQLLETTVNGYSFDECNKKWKFLDNSQMCALGDGTDSCGGDSGGPLTKKINGKTVVIGLVSFGERPCASKKPAVYTKVTSLLQWIQQNIENTKICNL